MAHPDLNELLNALLPMAQMLLTKQGEFLPIGAIMLADGEIRHVGAKIDGDDYPGSQPLIDVLIENFQKEAAKGRWNMLRRFNRSTGQGPEAGCYLLRS